MATGYSDSTKWKIEHAGRVALPVYQTVASFFFAISTIAVVGRIGIRLTIRRRLYLDDYVLIFAFLCLSAASGLYYKFAWLIYVLNVLKYDQTVFPTQNDLGDIMNAQAINYSLVALLWSTICSVKICFLISFKVLIKNVSRSITIWYWSAVGMIFSFWAIMVALPWIECPWQGPDLLKHCTPEPPTRSLIIATWLSFTFDALTDVMIVTIPIWILRHVRIRLSQKLSIAAFLCLSIVMIFVALIRSSLARYRGWGDLTVQYMLHYVEGAIAVIMAAVASYRAVFVENSRRKERDEQLLQNPEDSPDRIRARLRILRRAPPDTDLEESRNVRKPYIPFPKHLSSKLGMLTFLRGTGNSTQRIASLSSTELDTVSKSSPEGTWNSGQDSMNDKSGKTYTSGDDNMGSNSITPSRTE